jgi:glycosyltransferase involved in cell wall biosynthesis
MWFRRQRLLRGVGVVYPEIAGWLGGSRHIKSLAYSLSSACQSAGTDMYLLREQMGTQHKSMEYQALDVPYKVLRVADSTYFPGEWRIRQLLAMSERSRLTKTAHDNRISVLLPCQSIAFRPSGVKIIGWIPDFQHVYRPEFFSDEQRRSRDRTFQKVVERSTLLLLSSQNAVDHFAEVFPKHIQKARLAPFPSLFAFENSTGDVQATLRKFNLPPKFALVANQFWRHKNHGVVIEAIRQLHSKGIPIPLVITGLPVDFRERNNETTSTILQAIASAGLNRHVTVLGMLNDFDFRNLMRAAAVLIQPSLFEGWSTVLQDGKAVGRPVICSDIPVHREQAKEAVGFFRSDLAGELADILAQHWSDFESGPDPEKETKALAAEREFARLYGQQLLEICKEAVRL